VTTPVRLDLYLPPGCDARAGEPITVGVPFPRGACEHIEHIRLLLAGSPQPVQGQVTERWPDGSIRWALLDFLATVPGDYAIDVSRNGATQLHTRSIAVFEREGTADARADGVTYRFSAGTPHLFEVSTGGGVRRVRVVARDAAGAAVPCVTTGAHVRTGGPLRGAVLVEGVLGTVARPFLHFEALCHLFAGMPLARVEFTVRNSRAANHAGGYWELGDPASIQLRELRIDVERPPATADDCAVHCSVTGAERPVTLEGPVEIFQRSSGGTHFQSRVHVNRDGVVPLGHEGFQLRANGDTSTGRRANPVLWVKGPEGMTGATVEHFWQNFPKALGASDGSLSVGLFPTGADLHEIQPGEQKTHTIGLAFGDDPVSAVPLDWVRNPTVPALDPAWYSAACAAPYLTPAAEDPHDDYLSIVNEAIEGTESFENKRERIDEYGWRNFGDIHADHEAAPPRDPADFVSHYNNQYDPVNGFGIQFMRTADPRWWRAMSELARHVTDIDIYHTTADKSAYNGGLFWHTFHYVEAGKATHRAYPKAPGVWGGGPSNEHDYSTGLMLHYLLTGCERSRAAVLSLASWVADMDDGRLSRYRWFSRADTGLASSTASPSYHGPGRGAGNSIVTLLNAFRLTHERRWIDNAEALIRRCVHPSDDIDSRDLLNAELRWSYVVFLEALGYYLDEKETLGEMDCRYRYAQDSLLHYARWMRPREYPYLDKPEILEFPTETWAAQDMRKSDVFKFAARHAPATERQDFLERADFFFHASLDRLYTYDTRTRARPLVLMLSHGYMHAVVHRPAGLLPAPAGPEGCDFGRPMEFVGQKQIAIRRAIATAVASGTFVVLALVWLLVER
jgi:hypothetical protein